MQKILFSLLLVSTVSVAGTAENHMRPGLWEVTTTSMLLALVPQIPPDQMQKLTSLAKQYGLDMPQIQNGAATSKVCITQQMADQKIPSYFHPNQSDVVLKTRFEQKIVTKWILFVQIPSSRVLEERREHLQTPKASQDGLYLMAPYKIRLSTSMQTRAADGLARTAEQ